MGDDQVILTARTRREAPRPVECGWTSSKPGAVGWDSFYAEVMCHVNDKYLRVLNTTLVYSSRK